MTTQRSQPNMLRSLVWKETSQLKEFFIAMVVLAAFLQILLTVVAGFSSNPPKFLAIAMAGGFVALFAAACGATLFATEKETGTFQNLQLLPINSRQLATGKLLAAGTLPVRQRRAL